MRVRFGESEPWRAIVGNLTLKEKKCKFLNFCCCTTTAPCGACSTLRSRVLVCKVALALGAAPLLTLPGLWLDHSSNPRQLQQDLSLNLTTPNGSRSRWFARWNDSVSVAITPPNPRVPAADATKPEDTGNAKESDTNCSGKRSFTCSARKVAPHLFVDGRKRNRQAFNSHLTRLHCCGWLRVPATAFSDFLFASC